MDVKKYGVENLWQVVDFGFAIAEGVKHSKADGTFNALDLVHFIPAMTKLPAALTKIDMVPKEIADLDQEELAELVVRTKSSFTSITDDAKAIARVMGALKMVDGLVQIIRA